ncbi:MAG: thioesterase family protein [Mycolicibacterium aromaticivorans]|nr:thioesterase family protein [Mycolicibacterium aromaticivorans]
MYPRFDDAMTLHPLDNGFEANLNEHWTIGPKIHGGVMLALCAKAAREAYNHPGFEPVAVSADFLSAPDPGSVHLVAGVQKRGRRIGLVDVALTQGGRTCVRSVVTLGDPEHHVEPLLSANPVTPLMSVEPPDHIEPIGPGHPAAAINNLARGCDIRPDLDETRTASGAPVFKIWVRPKDGPVDVLFALMCGDISVPACYAVGRRGWAPTVQMTAYLRGIPDQGWLRVACTTTQIGQDWFDEDHTVVDSAGRIIVQTRQLALVPAQ